MGVAKGSTLPGLEVLGLAEASLCAGSNLGCDRNGFRAEPNLGNALGSVIR